MPFHTEEFSGGLVSIRDPTFLKEGELTKAEEAYYQPNDPSPRPAPGRAPYSATPLNAPVGVSFIERATGDLLLAHANGQYLYNSPTTGETGEFTPISEANVDVKGGPTFDTIQLGDTTALLNGTTPALIKGPTEVAPIGLELQTVAPALAIVPGTFGIIGGGHFWYWTTEYNSDFDMESGAVEAAVIEVITTTGDINRVEITRPAIINTFADKWRIYRSTSVPTADDYLNPFPVGFLVAEVDIDTTTYIDAGIPDFSTLFPMMLLVIGGVEVPLITNGPPPTPSTGDVMEESLVTNDVDNPSTIVYTAPAVAHSWPPAYIYNIDTKSKDRVIRIRRVGKILIVAMEEQMIRINYLLRDTDPEFDRGRAWEIISSNHGVTGFGALDLLTPDNGEPQLAFVHRGGLFVTDGYHIQPLEADLDWLSLVAPGAHKNIVLRNVPHKYILQMFYTPVGDNKNSKAIFFHYHSSHRKEGALKATGPISVSAIDAVYAHPTAWSAPTLLTLDESGLTRLEDRGTPPFPMKLRTRQILVSEDPADEAAAERVFIRHRGGDSNAKGLVNFRNQGPNGTYESLPPVDVDMSFEGFSQIEIRNNLHSFQMELESLVPATYWTLNYERLEKA